MREAEDRITLRDNLTPSGGSTSLFETLADQMNLTLLLDLPLLSLSNGQTRRARIVKAILDNPELLLLDEPLSNYFNISSKQKYLSVFAAGLDHQSRKNMNEALARLHLARSPRIILGLRQGEQVPDWVTHILNVQDGTASASPFVSSNISESRMEVIRNLLMMSPDPFRIHKVGDVVVDMKDVNVTYGTRKVTNYRS